MSELTRVRRHLYEQYAGLRRVRDRRARRALRRQIALLAVPAGRRPDEGGPSGVREPRRPHPPRGGAGAARPV